MSNYEDIEAANRILQRARRQLQEVVVRRFPVGARVTAVIGGHAITGHVVRYGQEWTEPDAVYFKNERTGKMRRFYAVSDRAEVEAK